MRVRAGVGFVHILFGVSVSLMADTVFRADFRGSCTLDPTGLKEDDSSVEIYVENIFNKETTHTHTPQSSCKCTHIHRRRKTNTNMHIKEDSTGKGTDDRETENTC